MGVALVAALLAACNKSPTSPSTTLPSDSGPSAGPTPTRIDIVVPQSLPPGESAQLTATAFFSDGSDRNVTNEAAWRSGDTSVLSISNTGLATAHRTGDIFVRAAFNGKESGQREVLVLPAGTYKVGGYVKDGEVPVPGARVEVTAGPATGLFAVTDSSLPSGGTYSLLGVSGDTEFRVTKDGYQPLVRTVRVTSGQQIDFSLTPLIPRADLSGTYTLTISAAADCSGRPLPEDVSSQTYTAVVTQHLAQLTVTLAGANFASDERRTYNGFQGVIEPSRIWFQLRGAEFFEEDPLNDSFPDPNAPFPDVSVQLTPSTFLFVGGLAIATSSPAEISGTLNGTIQTARWVGIGEPRGGIPSNWQGLAACRSTRHEFVLSR
jgi:hypothetical protein